MRQRDEYLEDRKQMEVKLQNKERLLLKKQMENELAAESATVVDDCPTPSQRSDHISSTFS